MAAIKIDGTALATQIREDILCEVNLLDKVPGLAGVVVGTDPADLSYAKGRAKDCVQCGFYNEEIRLTADITEEALLEVVLDLNRRDDIHGIIVQRPLPAHINEKKVLCAIDPNKDVDCVHPINAGRLLAGERGLRPCTPGGVMEMLRHYEIPLAGKHCVVVGRSNTVGKPQALMLLEENATVTICHSKTVDLRAECLRADILVSAVGRVNLITADMVCEGAVVIDVAMNWNAEGKLCGDVDYAPCAERASYITPVPGGAGPMTRVMLMKNALYAAKNLR